MNAKGLESFNPLSTQCFISKKPVTWFGLINMWKATLGWDELTTNNSTIQKPLHWLAANQLTGFNSYMFKVNNTNIRNSCEMCSKLTIKLPEQRHTHAKVRFQWSGFAFLLKSNFAIDVTSFSYFIVNFGHISHLSIMFLLLTLNKLMSTG